MLPLPVEKIDFARFCGWRVGDEPRGVQVEVFPRAVVDVVEPGPVVWVALPGQDLEMRMCSRGVVAKLAGFNPIDGGVYDSAVDYVHCEMPRGWTPGDCLTVYRHPVIPAGITPWPTVEISALARVRDSIVHFIQGE